MLAQTKRKIYLYKGGTSGFSNLGFEPYSEMYAYQVAQVMGVNAIRYTLTKDLKKTLCSKCELFTSKEYSYIPIGQLVSKGGMKAIFEYCQTLGQTFVDALEDMLVFDAIICNSGIRKSQIEPRVLFKVLVCFQYFDRLTLVFHIFVPREQEKGLLHWLLYPTKSP